MKTFSDMRWQRDVERCKPFRPLWKTDDESWIAERKEAWRAAYGRVGIFSRPLQKCASCGDPFVQHDVPGAASSLETRL